MTPHDAIRELGGQTAIRITPPAPDEDAKAHTFQGGELKLPTYEKGAKVATRKAYGDALAALGAADGTVVALDGEVGNSTYTETFADKFPERFFQMYIAEQQMIGAAVGMQVRGWKPFSATFAAFVSRAYDFIRMAAVSQANLYICGSHAGVSIGEDGPSQMGLEDLASLRAVHGSTVLYPSDPNQTAQLMALMASNTGINYIRTTRQATQVIYDPSEKFKIGGSRVAEVVGERRRDHRRCGNHVARGAGCGRDTRQRRIEGARDRPLLDQAARRGDAPRRRPGRPATC